VAFAAEAGAGVDQRDGGAEPLEAVGVDAGGDVAFEHADAELVPELHQCAAQQRCLAGARR
jgi:hypothetical protein